MERIILLGGAGNLAAVAAQRLSTLRPGLQIVLADRDADKARRRVQALGPGFSAEAVDVFDPRRLREVIVGARLVINATGPYFRTGLPVLSAAIDMKTDYIDFSDDVESAEPMLAMDSHARNAGVTALIGAGVAPGVANIAVRALADRLDVADSAQIAWVTGASPQAPGAEPGGRAVIEHMLHSCTGVTFTVRDGRRQMLPAFRQAAVLPFPEPLGLCRVYDIGHAELATIPRFLPTVRNVRTQGAVHPAPLNGFFQGLARAVTSGALAWDDAIEAIMALERGSAPDIRPSLSALNGVVRQFLRLELGGRDLLETARFLRRPCAFEGCGGLYIRVEGETDGKRQAWVVRAASRQTSDVHGMDDATATPLSVFAVQMLYGGIRRPGVSAPEAVADPAVLRSGLEALAYPDARALFEPEAVAPEESDCERLVGPMTCH